MKILKFLWYEKTQFISYLGLVLFYINQTFFAKPTVILAILAGLLILTPLLVVFSKTASKEHKKNISLFVSLILVALIFFAAQHDLLWQVQFTDSDEREKAEAIRLFLRISYLLFLGSAILFAILLEFNQHRHETNRGIFIRKKLLLSFSLLAFLIALNYTATLRPFMVDLTLLRKFSLSANGRELIKNIKTPVKITAFYPFFHDLHREMDLFLKDIVQTNSIISYSIHDALREREIAQASKVDRNGWLVIESLDPNAIESEQRIKSRRLSFTTPEQMRHLESDVLAALLATVSERQIIYFTVNHGEIGTASFSEEEQITRFLEQLKKNNYEIRYLTPHHNFPNQVPDDAAAVVILGPTKNFSPAEKKALLQYLEKGGRFLLALEREGADLSFLLQPFGLTFQNEPARSEMALKPRSNNLLCEQYAEHPLTRRLLPLPETERFSFFPNAGSFKFTQKDNFFVDVLVFSDSRSWVDKNRNSLHDKNSEPLGPLNIAVAAGKQREGKNQRNLVAFAAASFVQNRYLAYGQNLYLAVGALNWLLENEKIQGLVPYRSDEKPIRLSISQENILFYGFAIVYPIVILALGFFSTKLKKKQDKVS